MESFLFAVSVVLPLFLLIALGYFLMRINVFTDEYVEKTNKVCFRVFLPVMIFVNIIYSREEIGDEFMTIRFVIITTLVLVAIYMIVVPVLEKDNFKRGTIVQSLYRSNSVLLGVPIILNMYGPAGLAPMSVVIAVVVPLYNTLAVLIFSVFGNLDKSFLHTLKKISKDLATNPLIIASVLALIFVALDIKLPHVLDVTAHSIAVVAPTLALMALGGSFRFKKAFGNAKYIVPISTVKMIISPVVLIAIAVFMGFEGTRLAAIMILYCAPVAVSSQVTAQEMGADGELAGQLIVVTSILSCFTIFGFIYVLNAMSLL